MHVGIDSAFNDGRGFRLMRQFMFATQKNGEAERVANLQQPRSTRKSTLPSSQTI
jgi:hypothetical protein